jgi:hypothetical protein
MKFGADFFCGGWLWKSEMNPILTRVVAGKGKDFVVQHFG